MSTMPQQQAQAETEIVVGIVQGIVQKGADKYQVEVNVGQQNPRRLWTKDVNLVYQLQPLIGTEQTFLCGVSHWTNNQGQPVRSLWINGVGPQGMAAAAQQTFPQAQQPVAQAQQPMAQAQQPRVSDSDREARIHRQTATKVAAMLISHLPSEQRTLTNLLEISERLVGYYAYGIESMQGQQNPDGDLYPHGDEDIPF
jgi:hypothetical protein